MTAHARPLLGLAPGGVCRAGPVASPAVGSYPTLSPLPLGRSRKAVCFLWHFPSARAGRPLAVALSSWSPDFPPAWGYPHTSGCPAFWSCAPYTPSHPPAKGQGPETCKKLELPVMISKPRRRRTRETNLPRSPCCQSRRKPGTQTEASLALASLDTGFRRYERQKESSEPNLTGRETPAPGRTRMRPP